jgi:cardiolipin synthase
MSRRFIQRHYQHAVAMARERVWITCAYFIPNRSWRRVLRRAASRGVDVRVLVPRANDIPAVHFASRYTYQALLDAGVRIFEYLPSMLHAKALVVDGAWCGVGSYNLDQRSLMYNWEVAASIVDPGVCAALEQQFLADQGHSREIDPVLWPKRGLRHKLRERFWHFFRLLL